MIRCKVCVSMKRCVICEGTKLGRAEGGLHEDRVLDQITAVYLQGRIVCQTIPR